jgi:Heparinase II/III-like protein/Heparinase II/III N-terminus
MNRFQIAIKAATQLGLQKTALYARYQLGLKSGLIKLLTPTGQPSPKAKWLKSADVFPLSVPSTDKLNRILGDNSAILNKDANTILDGQFHCFGEEKTSSINLCPPQPLDHWTETDDNPGSGEDIKFIWEAARFGWVFPLGRAYVLKQDERYASAFWQHAESFLINNPPNLGPNWASGQEVALRILAFTFALQVFGNAENTTHQRRQHLLAAIAEHAQRIPPTILYARAQNNNHLITETIGLYTAGCILPDHPQAKHWRKLGWRWFIWAILNQIAPDGTYVQQSMNYHRLMLQAALWMDAQARRCNQPLPATVKDRLASATNWLYAYFDKTSGCVPNLGHNDGSRILPLATDSFADYRPTIQAAACAFLGGPILPSGPWDEASLWFGLNPWVKSRPRYTPSPAVLRLDDAETNSWAALRAVQYQNRPAQADQLHVELWWQGINIARDAGTYRYTAPPPWNNGLARTAVHNTITVDGQEQMIRAGRFLWLDWAQAKILEEGDTSQSITADHDGFQHLGISHRRTLSRIPSKGWSIKDAILPVGTENSQTEHEIILHWLLPNLPWYYDDKLLTFQSPNGPFTLQISILSGEGYLPIPIQIIRAGEVIYGPPADLPTLGWISPTYAVKKPALSIRAALSSTITVQLASEWRFPEENPEPKYC